MLERLDHLRDELVHIETQLGDPAVSSDPRRLVELGRRHHELQPVVTAAAELDAAREDLDLAEEMIRQSDGDERTGWRELRDGAAARVLELEESLRALLLPKDPNNDRNVIVEIRGAEGGEEANLFARVLYDMYRSYASSMGWQVEVLGAQPSDLGGFSDVAMLVKGDGAWSALKHEAGPHRVQRVPVTESQGRIHTSSAAVNVLPEADEVDVFIDPNDLQVDVFRSSGPGGQSVNTTDSAVRITHRPTGLVVSMQDEKSQLQNRDKAMRVLRSRLLQLEQDRVTAEHAAAKRDQVGRGGRSEKIRTYNFKENRVTDHRIGLTLYKLDQILGGELDELVDALRQDERRRQLEGSAP